MSSSPCAPNGISLERRIKNAKSGVPSDMRSVAAKIDRIAHMSLREYFASTGGYFLLKGKLDVDVDATFMEAASLIDELMDRDKAAGEKAMWNLMMPLVKLYDMVEW